MKNDIITIDQLRQEMSLKALNQARSVAAAAQLIGISERTLWRWKTAYRIEKDPDTGRHFIAPPKLRTR